MVHGINFGIQYVVQLSDVKYDYYNDILPLCTKLRYMVTYNKELNQLILFNKEWENKKRIKNYALFSDFVNNMLAYEYNREIKYKNIKELFDIGNCVEVIIYYYSTHLKNNGIRKDISRFSNDEWLAINKRNGEINEIIKNKLNYISQDILAERNEIFNWINLYNFYIDIDEESRNEIIKKENDLVDVQLTDEEKEIIDIIHNYPLFEGKIKFEGNILFKNFC